MGARKLKMSNNFSKEPHNIVWIVLVLVLVVGCSEGSTEKTATEVTRKTPPSAPANCYTTEGNICMSVSPITITCTDIPPGFLMECSANVPMDIKSAITSGTISVGVATGGTDYIKTTIKIIPDTAPGTITAQIPLTSGLMAGCTSGVQRQFVEVYDGDYRTETNPGGRVLLIEDVQADMTCSH